MGSMGNPSNTNWPPYNGYRDCSQGICSIYCPQWCYVIFPPPPAFQSEDDDDSGMNFSPLIIVVIGVLASAFLLVSYYTVISKYCKRREDQLNSAVESGNRSQSTTHEQRQQVNIGLDESLIKAIAVCKYKKHGGIVEGVDCAVCLCEFQEGESLRLLPKCSHAFHLPCIDTWLRSHSNCPLCRSHVMPGIPIPFQRPSESHITSSNLTVSSLVFQRRNDLVLVVDETRNDDHRDEVVINLVTNDNLPKYPSQEVQEIRRSTSSGSTSCRNPNLLVGDIPRIEEDYEDHDHEQVGSSSEGENSKSIKRSNTMKRSVSTGRFMFTWNERGNKIILPN